MAEEQVFWIVAREGQPDKRKAARHGTMKSDAAQGGGEQSGFSGDSGEELVSALDDTRLCVTTLCFIDDRAVLIRQCVSLRHLSDQPSEYWIDMEADFFIPQDAGKKLREEIRRRWQLRSAGEHQEGWGQHPVRESIGEGLRNEPREMEADFLIPEDAGKKLREEIRRRWQLRSAGEHQEGWGQHPVRESIGEGLRNEPREAVNGYLAEEGRKRVWHGETTQTPVDAIGLEEAAQKIDDFMTAVHERIIGGPSRELMGYCHIPESVSEGASKVFDEAPLPTDRYCKFAERSIYVTEIVVGTATNLHHLTADGLKRAGRDFTKTFVEKGLEKLEKDAFEDIADKVRGEPAEAIAQTKPSAGSTAPQTEPKRDTGRSRRVPVDDEHAGKSLNTLKPASSSSGSPGVGSHTRFEAFKAGGGTESHGHDVPPEFSELTRRADEILVEQKERRVDSYRAEHDAPGSHSAQAPGVRNDTPPPGHPPTPGV